MQSKQDLEKGVIGLQLSQFIVVFCCSLLEHGFVFRLEEAESDEALACG